MKKIVFFHIATDNFGGGSKMLLRLLKSLDTTRFEPVVLSQAEDELCKRAHEQGIHVKTIPFKGALDTYNRQLLSGSIRNSLAIPPRILQFNLDASDLLRSADVIWCKNLRAVLTILPSILTSRIPVIWNIGLGLESTGAIRYLQWIALAAVDHVFIESAEQAKRIFTDQQYQIYQNKLTVFNKGIDTNVFNPDTVEPMEAINELQVGTAASLTPRKGLDHLIDAIPQIVEKHPNVTFLIAGEAPEGQEGYERDLKRKIEQYGVKSQVRFLGWVDDMPAYLNSLDVFVLPSLNEGIPGTVREALAMATPVVATDVGGTADVVVNGETGYLVEPADEEQLATVIVQLLEDQEKRDRLGKAGRKRIVEEFSIEQYGNKYEEFLSRIV